MSSISRNVSRFKRRSRKAHSFAHSKHGAFATFSPAQLITYGVTILLLLCLAFGGASRVTDVPLIVIRPAAVLLIGLVAAFAPVGSIGRYKAPLLLLTGFAATMAIQLIPLPSPWWANLPLSHLYVDGLTAAGLTVWRPISIAPDLTVNSLLALLPPAAALGALATTPGSYRKRMLDWMLSGMVVSALLGLAQFAGGDNSPLYLWHDRSEGVADGLFANRNHHATFLACGLILLGAWASQSSIRAPERGVSGYRLTAAAGMAVLFLVTVVATGSRAGTILSIAAAGFGYVSVIRAPSTEPFRKSLPRPVQIGIQWGWLVIPLLLVVMILAGRAVTLDRLTATDALLDQRVRSLPVMLKILKAVFPFGAGYGAFDPLFRTFEPPALLHYGYFNHAHNDFLELLIVGGVGAAVVIIAGTCWWAVTSYALFRQPPANDRTRLARASSVAMLVIAAASTVDYPVRTPLIACMLTVLAAWMIDGVRSSNESNVPSADRRPQRKSAGRRAGS